MPEFLTIFDLLLPPIFFGAIFVWATIYKSRKIQTIPEYKYFTSGLIVKFIGAIALGLVYFFYYKGGDTVNYFQSANTYLNLASKNFGDFLYGWLGNPTRTEEWFFFDYSTDYPVYTHRDLNSFFVVRLLIPIVFISGKSYFASAIITAFITYSGIWKLFRTFNYEFPEISKKLAISILFIPSCVFWGSGLMKDSFTLSAVGWFTYSFYFFFIRKERKFKFLLALLLSSFVIISIKPYIFFALLPGSILWLSNNWVKKISNKTFRKLMGPILMLMGLTMGYVLLTQMENFLGIYRVDTVLERATIVQKDMKAEYYGGQTFDIGDFDASFSGVISKAPLAIFSGIFRPAVWDVRNVVMLVSAMENTYLLILAILLLFKLKFFGFFRSISKNPLLLFSMLFSLFFAFSVGLTVANFGSLVRLRIPELQFFVSGLFIIQYLYEKKSGTKLRI